MTESDRFDVEIERLEKEKNSLSDEAEVLVQSFIKLAQDRIVIWAPKFIESTAKAETEVTKKIGLDGLRSLKAGIQKLINSLPTVVKDAFNKDEYWPLRNRNRSSSEETNVFHQTFSAIRSYAPAVPQQLKRAHDETVRPVMAYLKQFGYQAAILKRYPPDAVILFDDHEFTKSAMELLTQYSGLYDKRWKVINDLEKIRREKEKAEAESLWNQA